MHTQASATLPWATLACRATPDVGDEADPHDDPSSLLDRLEALAALVAEDARVSGVEVRDGTTLGGGSVPEVIIYTEPAALPILQEMVPGIGFGLGLTLTLEASIRTDDDWRDSWKKFYAPMVLGDHSLLLRPSWIPRRPGDPTLELVLDPGRAFGTGQHETTRLCLDRLAALASARKATPASVLDLGCGSGILGLAAARLFPGVRRLTLVDNDPEATETAIENAELNGFAIDGAPVEVVTGTLDDIEGSFDLIVANIRPSVLLPIAPALVGRLRPGGLLLLSGILAEEGEEVAAAYAETGLTRLDDGAQGEWVALAFAASTVAP